MIYLMLKVVGIHPGTSANDTDIRTWNHVQYAGDEPGAERCIQRLSAKGIETKLLTVGGSYTVVSKGVQ